MVSVLQYSYGDIANWARFSGDYNPIHFDVAASKRFGHDSVVVHGMLAVLQSLETVQASLRREDVAGQWLTVTQRLRIPIYPGEVLELAAAAGHPPRRLTLRSAQAVKLSIDVKISPTSEPAPPASDRAATEGALDLGPIDIEPAALRDGVSSLKSDFAWLDSDLGFLQAAAFAQFMRLRVRTLEHWVQRALRLPDGSGYTVVQTSHRSIVHGSWLDGQSAWTDDGVHLTFAPTTMTTLNNGCACTCRIEISTGRRLPMFAEVGLLLSRYTVENQ